jgi:hypothetical protein
MGGKNSKKQGTCRSSSAVAPKKGGDGGDAGGAGAARAGVAPGPQSVGSPGGDVSAWGAGGVEGDGHTSSLVTPMTRVTSRGRQHDESDSGVGETGSLSPNGTGCSTPSESEAPEDVTDFVNKQRNAEAKGGFHDQEDDG